MPFVSLTGLRTWLLMASACAVIATSCGGVPRPPERGVLENNVTSWRFRRYQKLLDVEIWVPGNPAVGHTATYVLKDAEREGRIGQETMASAFVTRYEQDRGVLRALLELSQRLKNEAGYDVEVQSSGGILVISITGQGESWALWYSAGHVIKVGGRGLETVPEALVEAYGERYPSRLTGDVLDRPLPPEDSGADGAEDGAEAGAYDADNPSPDWDSYQSGQAEQALPGPTPEQRTPTKPDEPKKARKKPKSKKKNGKK